MIKGAARVDRRTKDLVQRLRPGEIAVIDHAELDQVSAECLVQARARAVVNAAESLSRHYPNRGPLVLCESSIPLVDAVGQRVFEVVKDGDELEIDGGRVLLHGRVVAEGRVVTRQEVEDRHSEARLSLARELDAFVTNTLEYARREKSLILGDLRIPRTRTVFTGRHAVVVVRGPDFRRDLAAILPYVREVRPVLVAVDGGADALLELGLVPDMIVGDMDSVSDEALASGAELVVHAYPDGTAPGLARLESLGLAAATFPAPGTSEDVAMLLAYERGASLIVAVGTHSSMVDFLDKGRKGMASTFLVRLKIGSILVDAKGVNQLYRGRMKARYLVGLALAALLPTAVVICISGTTRQLVRLLLMRCRLMLGLL